MNALRGCFRLDPKTGFQLALAAGKAGFQQRECVGPRAGVIAGQWIFLGAFQFGIDHEHLVGLAQRDGLRRIAEFPAKAVRRSEPDATGRRQWLRQRFQSPCLDDFSRPGLDVVLGLEPLR